MNLAYFIARKVAASGQQSFSRLILRIAVVAVALSMAVMIASTAVIRGFKNQIGEKIFGFWGHIHITSADVYRTLTESEPISLEQDFYPSLDTIGPITYLAPFQLFGRPVGERMVERRTHGGIRHIQVFALKPGIIKTKEEIEGIVLKGVGPDFDWSFFDQYLLEGGRLQLQDSVASEGILISRQTADRLQLQLGDRFIFYFVDRGEPLRRRFTVQGIYKTGLEEYDRKFALVDIRKVQQLLKWRPDQVGGFEVFLDDIRDMDIFTEYIYLEILPNDLFAENIREKFPAIFEWLGLQDINEVVIIVLMLVVSIINMVTALMILILERTNMIGILKALGYDNWGIRKIFLYYAAYIIGLGLFWGNLIGIGLCLAQQKWKFITLSEENYYLPYAPIELDPTILLALNGGTFLLILLFLVLPSYLVTRISPVKAIRFK